MPYGNTQNHYANNFRGSHRFISQGFKPY